MQFPPDKSGGLIEANSSGPGPRISTTGFRRINPAASLKHFKGEQHAVAHEHRFRRINPAASLKQRHAVQDRPLLCLRFRRINPAASLKPDETRYRELSLTQVSAG